MYLALSLVYLLKITTLYGLEYNYETFDVQPHPIQFLREPNDHYIFSSVDVTFVCSLAIYNDFSKISWFHNNTIVGTGPHYTISNKGQSINTLTIRNVSNEDQGDYHCCAYDWKTKIRSKPGRLHVVGNGKMSNNSDGVTTHKINAVYKSTVILSCDLKPDTRPMWLQNELVLYSKEFTQTLFIDESNNLVLVNVSEDHSGHYQCQVNESGTIRNGSSYELTVHSLMGSLDHESRISSSSSQYLLIVPDHCEQSPHNQTVTLQCPVTGHPSPVINWYLNGESVNLTDYNVTDNVGNNTWIIEGGDPCRLIGYWQCFATNEAGTIHNEIRVLPYGWSNQPGKPTLNVAKLSENIIYDVFDPSSIYYADTSLHVNVTWSAPQYLGGLNASDIYYQLHATGYEINTTETYSVLFYDEVNLSIDKTALDVSIAVHYNGSTTDTLYIPTNIIEKKQYNNLLCDAVEFKPPQIFAQCFENGTAHFSWKLSPNQALSLLYLEYSLNGWLISGSCTNENDATTSNVYDDDTYIYDYMDLSNLMNGTQCIYEIQPDYDGCNCGQSCKGSASCTISIVPPTTTAIYVLLLKSLDKSITSTTVDLFMFSTMESRSVSITSNLISFTTQLTLSVSSTDVVADNFISLATTQSISNDSTTIVPAITSSPTSSSGDTSSATLFITIAVLISLLIGSIIIFCAVLCIYRWKSTGKYADIRFLKMSQTIKMMKPPLSNNYCSTINIADESVCEMPVNKVKRWIDDNDFKKNGDILRSESFQSIATSQMFAYIRKDDKNDKKLSSESLADYIDDFQLKSVCNNTCNEGNRNTDSLISLYVDETHFNQKSHLTRTNSSENNPYCDENAVFNNVLHLSLSHTSLPDYIEESHCGNYGNENKSHESLSSTSYRARMSSLPVLMPSAPNPVVHAKSFGLLQSSNNETGDKIQISDSNLNDNHDDQKFIDDNVDSGLNTDCSRVDTDLELNSHSITEAQNSGYYDHESLLSNNSKGMNFINTMITESPRNSSRLGSNHSDTNTNASSDIPTSSLGYVELPADKHTYFDSRTRPMSEFDFDIDSQPCDISDTSNINIKDNSSVDLGYVHLPLSNEDLKQNLSKDNITMTDYILSFENVV